MPRKLDIEPRLQGQPPMVIDWARVVALVVNPVVDAVGDVRASATPISAVLDGPAFSAGRSSAVSMVVNTPNLVIFDAEHFDTNSCYDNTTGKFQPTTPGYYYISGAANISFSAGPNNVLAMLYKNGAEFKRGNQSSTSVGVTAQGLIQMNGTSDYVQFYAYPGCASGTATLQSDAAGAQTHFEAFFARRA